MTASRFLKRLVSFGNDLSSGLLVFGEIFVCFQ